ncbi:MAG: molybdopterin-dependent oxidoreductase [Acidimicrobiales bacterium]
MSASERASPVTSFRTCPLCEAGCGLEITTSDTGPDASVVRIRGDKDDVFSRGYICPKGSTLKHLREDPDRLRSPVRKQSDGTFREISWDEAWSVVARLLTEVIDRYGREAVAVYLGNPNAHNLGALLYGPRVIRALGTRHVYSASTLDQRPKEVSAALMFGGNLSIPVPDIDRTDLLLVLGANPLASNGSVATAPDWPGRLAKLVARGGKLIVVDPRRTQTAEVATEHLFIRPGTDALWLFAIVNVLHSDRLVALGSAADLVAGVEEVLSLSIPFTPEAVASATGIPAPTTRRIAHTLAAASRAVVYGRIGTTAQRFGTLTSWLVDVVNVLTGNLDRAGGAMFALPAVGAANTRGAPGHGRGLRLHRHASRVRGVGETMGELPAAVLAEEIDTPGEGQIRALITIAGNPVLSTPNGPRLDAALDTLDAMIAVDIYVNETTRHADVILPVPDALAKSHYDIPMLQVAVHNVANYSPAVVGRSADQPDEWEVLAKLAHVARGRGDTDVAAADDIAMRRMVQAAVADVTGAIHGRDPDEIMRILQPRTGPERMLDFMLRTGPYGDAFGRTTRDWIHARQLPSGLEPLTLDVLMAHPHGVDLGPNTSRLPEVLRTPSGKIELAPQPIVEDVERLRRALQQHGEPTVFMLIGRRDLRSNNSWMHNIKVLVSGKPRCTLHVHPSDATRLGLTDGADATVRSRVGELVAPVEITDGIMPGVVSLPHGWGHDLPGLELSIAAAHAGVNCNAVADETLLDAVSGNAALNGIPVSVFAADPALGQSAEVRAQAP